MKKIFILPLLSLALFSCNMADDKDYESMAKDLCRCFDESLDGISERGENILIESAGNDFNFQEEFDLYQKEDAQGAVNDMLILANLETSLNTCGEKLKKKYENVYSNESEEEVLKRIIDKLNDLDGCEIAKIAMNAAYQEEKN